MSVVSCVKSYSGPTGKLTNKGGSYSATYTIITDDPLDGPATIWTYLRANVADLLDTYEHGNDADGGSFLQSWSVPQHTSGDATVWTCTAEYEPLSPSDDNNDRNENGDKVKDPKDMAPEVSIRYSLTTEAVEKAKYLSGFTHAPAIHAVNDEIVPQNSATEPFDPPLERDAPIQVIRISKRVDNWEGDDAADHFNCINSEKLKFKAWTNATHTFEKYTLKVQSIDATHVWNESAHDWEWDATVELHYNPKTWRPEVIDRGMHRIARAGDPDGRGGTISPSDLPQGVMQVAIPVDFDGLATNTPILLDGAGNPQAPGGAPVLIKYGIYEEKDLIDCPIVPHALEHP